MPLPFEPTQYRELLRAFLQEDLGGGDITTESIIPAEQRAQARALLTGERVALNLPPCRFRRVDLNKTRAALGRTS
jgi:nicotinate-nucleotide pyrophosphorylase